jgi:two-component system response regulator DevR
MIARILFVEYHSAFRQSASYIMNRDDDLEVEVVAQAGSVGEAREEMARGGIDAAVVDVPLPDEGAAEMVRDLVEANPSIPVLVLIHPEDEMARERFLAAGASEVLPKSVDFGEILAAVGRLGREADEEQEEAAG